MWGCCVRWCEESDSVGGKRRGGGVGVRGGEEGEADVDKREGKGGQGKGGGGERIGEGDRGGSGGSSGSSSGDGDGDSDGGDDGGGGGAGDYDGDRSCHDYCSGFDDDDYTDDEGVCNYADTCSHCYGACYDDGCYPDTARDPRYDHGYDDHHHNSHHPGHDRQPPPHAGY